MQDNVTQAVLAERIANWREMPSLFEAVDLVAALERAIASTTAQTEAVQKLVDALEALVEDNLLRGPFDEPLGESEQSPLVNTARAALAAHRESQP